MRPHRVLLLGWGLCAAVPAQGAARVAIPVAGVRVELPQGTRAVPPDASGRSFSQVARYAFGDHELQVLRFGREAARRQPQAGRRPPESFLEYVLEHDPSIRDRKFSVKRAPFGSGDGEGHLWEYSDSAGPRDDRRMLPCRAYVYAVDGGDAALVVRPRQSMPDGAIPEAFESTADVVGKAVRRIPLDRELAEPGDGLPWRDPDRRAWARPEIAALPWHPHWEWRATQHQLVLFDATDEPERPRQWAAVLVARAERVHDRIDRLFPGLRAARKDTVLRLCSEDMHAFYLTRPPGPGYRLLGQGVGEIFHPLEPANPDRVGWLEGAVCFRVLWDWCDGVEADAWLFRGLTERMGGIHRHTEPGWKRNAEAEAFRLVAGSPEDRAEQDLRATLERGVQQMEEGSETERAWAFALVDYLCTGALATAAERPPRWQTECDGLLERYLVRLRETRDRTRAHSETFADTDLAALASSVRSWAQSRLR